MSRRRVRIALGAAGVVLALLALGFGLLASTTSYTQRELAFRGRPGDPVPPAWTRPCWRHKGGYYVLPCGRVRGVVLYRERRDPDGDGDVHGLVVAGRRLVIIKSVAGAVRIPGVGHRVDLSGTTTSGRFGLTVVEVHVTASARP